MALITANDNADGGQARQRFATIVISKTAADGEIANSSNNSNENSNNADNNAKNAQNSDNKKPKEVRVVTQRLWAFRPVF